MTAWAIVAVPSKMDPVWKYSSEKVPHLTVLYFGEQNDGPLAARISEFVEHAATTLHPFGLSVDERGVLGDEKADVLFFNDLFAKQITQFRDNLLKNDEIFTLWNSVEQYPTWTPHLTMGYPETPAKPIPDGEFQPSWVNFDRIEFWVNDFDGPSFRLADAQDTALAHYGVKGMKWGVRRDGSGAYVEGTFKSEVAKARQKVTAGTATLGDAHLAALKSTSRRVANGLLGDKTYWKNIAALSGISAAAAAGIMFPPAGIPAAVFTYTATAAGALSYGALAQNTRRAVFGNSRLMKQYSQLGPLVKLRADQADSSLTALLSKTGSLRKKDLRSREEVSHADMASDETFGDVWNRVNKTHSDAANLALYAASTGTKMDLPEYFEIPEGDRQVVNAVIGMFLVSDKHMAEAEKAFSGEMKQSALGEVLAHHGVKGMKWGVRRDERTLSNEDRALNISQRAQVKVASSISALAAIGISTNTAATIFQLQSRIEQYKTASETFDFVMKSDLSPVMKVGAREAKNDIVRGIIGSAVATSAATLAIGITTKKAATAYFAPLHKAYGDAKPKINSDLRSLSKSIKKGKTSSMTEKQYHAEVSKIVSKHMTADKSALLSPFNRLAKSQLGTQYNTKSLKIRFDKLPNTELYEKMTVVTPNGLKLVKAVKVVEHADSDEIPIGNFDLLFDYKLDSDGLISEFSCPTIEVLEDLVAGTLDVDQLEKDYAPGYHLAQSATPERTTEEFLAHFGVKGMRWGVRRSREELGYADGADSSSSGSSSKSGTSSSSGTSTDAEDADALSIKAYKNGIESLSNQELQTLTMRNNAERQYLESIANYQRTLSPPTNPNQKLSDKVARMNLEKQYKTLQKELNPPKPKPVRTFAKKVAGDVLKEQATTLISATVAKKFAIELDRRGATTQAKAIVKKSLKGAMDVDELPSLKSLKDKKTDSDAPSTTLSKKERKKLAKSK